MCSKMTSVEIVLMTVKQILNLVLYNFTGYDDNLDTRPKVVD